MLNFCKGSLDNSGETTMFIRLEDTNKESGIPIIAYDMDDNGNNRPNAEFTVSMPEITFKKDHGSTDQNRSVPDQERKKWEIRDQDQDSW